jgi:riboflavin-specific deaminase-like protein
MNKPIPRITVSYAQSLDGRIATSTGDSRWISCPRTITLAHKLRRDNEVILVGIGTVLRDDPELSCRLRRPRPSPVRVVLDSHLRLPSESTILRTCGTYRTIVYTTTGTNPDRRRRLELSGAEVHEIAADEQGQVPVRNVVENLAGQGFRTVFVEGGAKVITSFLRAGLVHRMVVVIAPVIIGRGVEAVGDLEITSLDQALRPRRSRTRRLGRDRVWELYFDEP